MDTDLIEAHRLAGKDTSPLQFISAKLLEHYRRCEAELAALKAARALTPDTRPPLEPDDTGQMPVARTFGIDERHFR